MNVSEGPFTNTELSILAEGGEGLIIKKSGHPLVGTFKLK
jgi:hypothetical protein